MAQHRPTGSEITPPYAPRSSRFGLEPPSVEDDVDVWRYAIVSCMPETTTTATDNTIKLYMHYMQCTTFYKTDLVCGMLLNEGVITSQKCHS